MNVFLYRLGWGVAALFALLFMASLARDAQGGSLDPDAGPGSTMQSLDELPPSWHQQLSAVGGCNSERFECVLPIVVNPTSPPELEFKGVLDHETGLVWERAPVGGAMNWYSAFIGCQGVKTGNRYGWRLPTTEELRTLISETDTLPVGGAGGPFSLPGTDYWTVTTDPVVRSRAYIITKSFAGTFSVASKFDATPHRLCVRGIGVGTDGGYIEESVPPSWTTGLDASKQFSDSCKSQRFTCDVGQVSVTDKETGLVWERSPSSAAGTWAQAQYGCINLFKANRFGWRLPTVEELTSLFDTSPDRLPDGHPFLMFIPLTTSIWTATTSPFATTDAFIVTPSQLGSSSAATVQIKTMTAAGWCVRGGQGSLGG